jgi:transposase InsO family protein
LDQKDKDHQDYLLIKGIFEQGKNKIGWRPIQMKLINEHSKKMNHKKIKRIMKKYNLITKVRRRNPYKDIARKTTEHRTFDNILDRNFKQTIPRKILCTDITYLHYGQGRKAYLQGIKDIASNEIISFELSNNLTMKFVLDSLDKIKSNQIMKNETLIHSDQGFHYTNPSYIKRVKSLNLIQSMSRKGNCIDNAPMESFFGHLKDEVDYKQARTFDELNGMIHKYIDYYNNKRYQWNLKKMTPVQYRNHLLANI